MIVEIFERHGRDGGSQITLLQLCLELVQADRLRFLFPLWALFVVVMLFRGYVLGSYTFAGEQGFKQALLFFTGAVLAFIGSLTVLHRRLAVAASRRPGRSQ